MKKYFLILLLLSAFCSPLHSEGLDTFQMDDSSPSKEAFSLKRKADDKVDAQDFSAAAKLYQKAIDKDSKYAAAYVNLTATYMEMKEFDKSIEVGRKGLNSGITQKEILGLLHYNVGHAIVNKAVEKDVFCAPEDMMVEDEMNKAIQLYPKYGASYFHLAAYMNDCHHDSSKALKLFKKACDLGEERGCFQYQNFKAQGAK